MAECHPVGFQWVMEAKARGAKVIHVDPRFTPHQRDGRPARAAPRRHRHRVPRRHRQLHPRERPRVPRVRRRTTPTRAVIIGEDFRDTEDLDGLFSGFDAETAAPTTPTSWQYDGRRGARGRRASASTGDVPATQRHGGARRRRSRPASRRTRTATLQHPRCVFQLLKRHFARYTPEMVAEICGVPQRAFLAVAEALCANSGPRAHRGLLLRGRLDAAHRRRAVHPHRRDHPAAARQHRPARRRHPGAARPRLDPGLDRHPDAVRHPARLPPDAARARATRTSTRTSSTNGADTGFWGDMDAYTGQPAEGVVGRRGDRRRTTSASTTCRASTGDHSHLPDRAGHARRQGQGLLRRGREPGGRLGQRAAAAPGAGEARLAGGARLRRDRDARRSGTTARRSRRASCGPRTSRTEVFFLPAAAHTEKDGTFTNTQRLLQWHHKAVEPPGDARSELWFMLPPRPQHPARSCAARRDAARPPLLRPDLGLPDAGRRPPSPSAEAVLHEINGCDAGRRAALERTPSCKADGSTACGCWIYCGVLRRTASTRPRGASRAGADLGRARVGLGLAGEPPDPLQPRVGRPGRQAVVGAQGATSGGTTSSGEWTGARRARLHADQAARLRARPRAPRATDALGATSRSSCRPTGWLAVRARPGCVDGPLPTHYEPHESPVREPALRPAGEPGAAACAAARTRYNPSAGARLGRASRTSSPPTGSPSTTPPAACRAALPYLAELQPEMFCEVCPELAARARASSTAAGPRSSPRATAIEARVLVTERMRAAAGRRAASSTRSACRTTGAATAWSPATSPTTSSRSCSTRTCTSRRSRRRPATSGPGRRPRGRRCRSSSSEYRAAGRRRGSRERLDAANAVRPRLATATRPSRAWASSPTPRVCIGCKACEVACKEWNHVPDGRPRASPAMSYDNTGDARRRHLAARGVHRAAAMPARVPTASAPDGGDGDLRWLMSLRRLQALHRARPASRSARPARCSAPSSARSWCRTTSATAAATASRPARSA